MENNKDVVFVCITPIRDEEWILPYFLKINSIWADHIIILDQCSIDNSPEIAKAHPKVTYLRNDDSKYDELYRQKILYNEARKIKASKLIIFALDADEYIPPSVIKNVEWEKLQFLPKGTRIYTRWIHVMPKLQKYYDIVNLKPFGYVDDGTEINGGAIHNERVPENKNVSSFRCNEIVNIHLGYVPVIRNYKKHTWYILWEYLNKNMPAFSLNMKYQKFIGASSNESIKNIDESWLPQDILTQNLDITPETITWWDIDIVNWLKQYGESKFKKLDIWDFDWNIVNNNSINRKIRDPRSFIDKLIMVYIKKVKYIKGNWLRPINYLLKIFWK